MKKLIALICIAITVVMAVALTIVLVVGIGGNNSRTIFGWRADNVRVDFFNSGGRAELVKEESISLNDVQNLELLSSSGAMHIRATDSDMMTVRQYGYANDLFDLRKSGDRVTMDAQRNNISISIISFNLNQRYEIDIPRSWLGNVEMRTSSGGIRVQDSFEWNDVNIKCTSGGITVERDLTVNRLDVSVSSGGINMRGTIKADNVQVKTMSGGATAQLIDTREFNIESSSGGIRVDELRGQGDVRCTSGGIRIALLYPTGNVELRVTSGGIRVDVPRDLRHLVSTSATSGAVSVNER
jgi:lia operon protein LiaG